MTDNKQRSETIRALNDAYRKYPWNNGHALGRTVVTPGVNAKGPDFVLRALNAVAGFNDFSEDNDPHGEHDYGSVELDGNKLAWKIDYYDRAVRYGSQDPTDPDQTTRVMTIMLVEEY